MTRAKRLKRLTALVGAGVIAASLAGQSVAAGQNCMKEGEVTADKIRFIQTQMMVAALQCRSHAGGVMPQLYNSYVKAHRSHLLNSERDLIAFVAREKGGTFTRYLTDVANKVSLASIDTPNFCNRMKFAAEQALVQKNPLDALAFMPVRYEKPVDLCQVDLDGRIAEAGK